MSMFHSPNEDVEHEGRKQEFCLTEHHRSPDPALPLLLPRVRPLPFVCSEPDPERGDVREA